jgi:hypothetical protein
VMNNPNEIIDSLLYDYRFNVSNCLETINKNLLHDSSSSSTLTSSLLHNGNGRSFHLPSSTSSSSSSSSASVSYIPADHSLSQVRKIRNPSLSLSPVRMMLLLVLV